MFVYHSTSFHAFGFTLCLTASFLSGARWTISQKVVQKSKLGLENPIDMIYHIQPLMIVCTIPLAASFEGKLRLCGRFGSALLFDHSLFSLHLNGTYSTVRTNT